MSVARVATPLAGERGLCWAGTFDAGFALMLQCWIYRAMLQTIVANSETVATPNVASSMATATALSQ